MNLRPGDALLLVDLQNDFLPGGSLAVPRADEVLPVVHRYLALFQAHRLPVFATRDWHPPDHCSFQAQGGGWPPHCIAGTEGAQFPEGLDLPADVHIASKATAPERDAYSGFDGTELDRMLKRAGVRRLFVTGLATDYCVLETVKAALALGYSVHLLTDAIRAIDVRPGDGERAIAQMQGLGAVLLDFQTLME
jgi:nicotinamidase/pyrazinamidase